MSSPKLPPLLHNLFGPYEPVILESGEPVAWGFIPKGHLGENIWESAKEHGTWLVIGRGVEALMYGGHADWALITRWLTPEEAEKKFGRVTNLNLGPSNGFRSVTYGSKTFHSNWLQPTAEMAKRFWSRTKVAWVIRVSIRLKTDEPKSLAYWRGNDFVAYLRSLAEFKTLQADVCEIMLREGWSLVDSMTFEREEPAEHGYERKRMLAALKSFENKINISPFRKSRKTQNG
jgi:hypothetical protein